MRVNLIYFIGPYSKSYFLNEIFMRIYEKGDMFLYANQIPLGRKPIKMSITG